MPANFRARQARRLAAFLAPLAILAGCQPQTTTIPIPPTRVVDVGRAAQAFRDICLLTAPDFRGASERFARHGLTTPRGDAIVYDETGTLSVRVDGLDTSRGERLRCSVVYEDPNRFIAEERIDQSLRGLPGRLRGGRQAQFPAVGGGTRQGRAWTYIVGGRRGELLDVPHSGGNDLGVLILQYPTGQR